MSRDRARQRFVELAAVAVWVAYTSSYAIAFALSGMPVFTAIRGALTNSIPDALIAIAAFRISRAIDRQPTTQGLLARHVPRAIVLIVIAAASKGLLLWFDVVVVARIRFQFNPGLVFWYTFTSALVYVTVAAATHA
jgi:hypothetical protein